MRVPIVGSSIEMLEMAPPCSSATVMLAKKQFVIMALPRQRSRISLRIGSSQEEQEETDAHSTGLKSVSIISGHVSNPLTFITVLDG
jgi:hypothetical protein